MGYNVSRNAPAHEVQSAKVSSQDGFFVVLDHAGNSGLKILKSYGIDLPPETPQEEIRDKLQEMVTRIMMNPKFNGSRILGVVFSEYVIEKSSNAKNAWDQQQVVPIVRIGTALEAEDKGVSLLKELPDDAALLKALDAGCFGVKLRSSIRSANSEGIYALVNQLFDGAKRITAKGLVPFLQPEVDFNADQKSSCENILRKALMGALSALSAEVKIILSLTIPEKPGQFSSLLGHPNVIRVIGKTGDVSRAEAIGMLKNNPGMIAGFGRSFTETFNVVQTDKEFTQVVDDACQQLYDASRQKSG